MNPTVKAIVRAARRGYLRLSNRLEGYDPVGAGTVPKALTVCTDDACTVCLPGRRSGAPFRIVYLLPSDNTPSGGNKVSYRHIELICEQGVPCFAFHPEKPRASYSWFAHQVKTLPLAHFDPRHDFLVIPEVWAALAAKFCVPAGLHYAIWVQNGFLAHISAGFEQSVVREAYRNADLVLSVSSHASEMTSLIQPFVSREKILRLYLSVPPRFTPGTKERLISYMPRKLRPHSERLCLYLDNALPGGWQLQAIDNLDEAGVAAVMARSSIFLSFSDLEGYGLPPLEAALAGNIVVGYTGEAGKEYFRPPIFREVPSGDLLLYVEKVRSAIEDAEHRASLRTEFLDQAKELARVHSQENERAHLATFVERVRHIMRIGAATRS